MNAVTADPVVAVARRRRWVLAGLLVPGLAWLTVFFVAPMLVLAQSSLQSGSLAAGYTFTWRFTNYSDALARYGPHLARSFGYAAAATVVALVLAYPLAYFIALRAGRWRRLLLFVVVLPLLVNFLIRTLAWKIILADEGAVVGALQAMGLLAPHGRLLATGWAVVAGLTYNLLPFMVLPIYASLHRLDGRLIEAANDLYAGPVAAFRTITWPLSRPGVVAGTLLTFIPAAGDYVNARFLGTPAQSMIGNVIESRFLVVLDYPTAAALSFVLLIIILAVVVAYLRRLPVDEVI